MAAGQRPGGRRAVECAADWSVFPRTGGLTPGDTRSWRAGLASALIVDPEPGLRLLARVILEPTLRCLEAESAVEAWRVVLSEHLAAVFLEVRLPEVDGYTLCRRIAGLPAGRRPPIILLSTDRRAEAHSLARTAGASAFVAKPYRPATLQQVLYELQVMRISDGGLF